MIKSTSLDALWDSAIPTELVFNSDKLDRLPATAKRYLEHAIAPGTKLAAAVRIKMHGEIKLKKWIPIQPVYELDGILALSGSSQRANSSEPRSMMQSIARPIDTYTQIEQRLKP